ncbi:hypothetical protein S40285_09800 [Stachybotrys chlorohalonatus IBT 40285]|uniref:Uncharacterized protein n=1 Tax=Stachybotrys chlorohalonatus (strain IBT 40285) TaxID=1283841 RepID=A0A084Q8A0_STAC4|nr:hypothetical protein S40285_09800 [Stachybotrys chlorohalonata IBT 40285]
MCLHLIKPAKAHMAGIDMRMFSQIV